MSVQPGMPEHRGLADRIKTLEAQVARINRARSMQSTSLDGGTFRVKNGGVIELVDDNDDVVAELDKTGLTVGDDVVLDSDGLKITDVLQEANWVDEHFDFGTTLSLSSSETELVSVTVEPPPWVETLSVVAYGGVTSTQLTTDPNRLSAFVRIDGVDGPKYRSAGPGVSLGASSLNQLSVPAVFSRTVSSPSASLSVAVRADIFDDSPGVDGSAGLTVLAVGRLAS